ncbi:MAG: peptidylprolyl isomerase [Vicinamibacteria bacterium]
MSLLASLLALGCAGAPAADPVVLALGEQQVRRSEFDRHVRGLEGRNGAFAPDVRRAVFESFVEERVLVLKARAEGLIAPQASPEEERTAVERLLASRVLEQAEVSDADVDAYYAGHAAEFEQPERVTLRQILVGTENEARDVRRRLQRDPRSFETLARTQSRAPDAVSGGMMGSFSRGELPPELDEPAFALRPGRVSDVVKSPYGYHVLKVDGREPARTRGLEEARAEIRTRLAQERSDRAVRAFVLQLLETAKVNYEAANAGPAGS